LKETTILIKDKYPEFEVADHQNVIIRLTKHNWEHIIQRRGSEFHNYWDNIKDTVINPDIIAESKIDDKTRIYIQEKKVKRNFKSKYLIVLVNSNNDIITSWFSKKIKCFKNINRVEK